MKQYFMKGASVLLLGGFLAGCSHEETDLSTYVADKIKAYEQVFISEFGSIDPNQDWGFGTTTRGVTRAVFTDKWTNDHSCNWESKLYFKLPAGAIDVTQPNFDKSGSVYYIPEGTTGEVSLGWLGLNSGAELYNYGNITAIKDVNYNGTITFYNAGTMTNFGPSSGGRHTVINIGNLTVCDYANIGDLYNGGALVLERGHNPYWENIGGSADIPNAMNIYSNGAATIEMPDGGDLKAVCDIHGTLKVGNGKNLKIQNSTTKYICGIESTAKVENVDGPLQTSYVKANLFTFDGNPIYLLPGGYVDVTTLQVPNSNCHVYGHTGSVALIEATNVEFGNKNDFTHTFSDNIYFKVSGYVKVDNCYAMGQSHYFNNVADYLADTTHSDEFALAASRVNAGNASGSPACGSSWTIGEPDTESKVENLIASGRVFCEDLGQVTREDIDFNDVVFDAYIYEVKFYRNNNLESTDTICKITLLAAGGTLPLTVAGKEVHDCFGEGTGTIINTIVDEEGSYGNSWVTKSPIDLGTFNYSKIVDIPIVVLYGNGTVQELEAGMGKVPRKICVPIGTPWAKERNKLKAAYPDFQDYVNNSTPGIWSNRVGTYLYPSGN